MKPPAAPDPPVKKTSNGASVGGDEMLTHGQAAMRLGITSRTFRKVRAREARIEGACLGDGGAWMFPAASIDAMRGKVTESDYDEEDEEGRTVSDAQAALMREVVKASQEVHKSAAIAMTAAVDCIKGTDPRTKYFLDELHRMGEALGAAQKQSLDVFALIKDLIVGQGELEATRIKTEADQTVRIERTKVAASGIKTFAPIVKAGLARWLRAPAIERDAQAETVLELVKDLKGEVREKIGEVLDDEQQEAMLTLVGYAEGAGNIKGALRTLRSRMTSEQMQKLAGLLNERQLTAIGSLFEADEDEEPKKQEDKKQEEKKTA